MTKAEVFLVLSLSFIAGIVGRSFWAADEWTLYFLGVSVITLLAVFWKNPWAAVAACAFLAVAIGIWRTDRDLIKLNNLSRAGERYSGLATVVKEPEQKEAYLKIILMVDPGPAESKLKFLTNAPLYSGLNYGDEIKIGCNLKVPEKIEDFDYPMYLAKDGIYYICEKGKIEKTGRNNGNKIYTAVLNLKNGLEKNIAQVMPEPQAALAKGLLIGGSSQLPKKVQENFSRTGMSHIVAVSGYNVTIIAEYLIGFFIFVGFWRRQAFWFAVVGIIVFVAMIGFPSSAVRAGVMGSLLLWAMKNGRLANSYNAIISAGVVMLIINPLALRWDIGFQLSFLAAIGIIALAPFWEKVFIQQHKALGFAEIFFLSLSAQIFVLPIIFYNFHIFSVVSLVANLLVLPIIPITMLLVFLTAIAGFIFQPLSLVLAWLAYLPLKYEIWVINTLASLNWSSMEIKNFGWLGVVLWYVLLVVVIYFFKKCEKTSQVKDL